MWEFSDGLERTDKDCHWGCAHEAADDNGSAIAAVRRQAAREVVRLRVHEPCSGMGSEAAPAKAFPVTMRRTERSSQVICAEGCLVQLGANTPQSNRSAKAVHEMRM